MDASLWLLTGIFAAGYALIVLEQRLFVDKSAIALVTGVVLWGLVAILRRDDFTHNLEEMGSEIFGIFAFLLAAMTLVEVLVHHRFFDVLQTKLANRRLTDRPQFVILMVLTFFLSALLDNLTVTIVMAQICLRFFTGRNRLIAVAGVVILANAGGAWSPVGDVTTIMIWLGDKFSAWEIISQGLLPSLAIGAVATGMLVRKIKGATRDVAAPAIKLTRKEIVVNSIALSSFSLSLVANLVGLQPYMGLLLGLGVTWVIIHYYDQKARSNGQTHLEADINQIFQKVDVPALMFFVGILMAVSALAAVGVLQALSAALLGETQEFSRVAIGSVALGLVSAVLDNVPLTALALDIVNIADPHIWVLLALAVGTGGSALVIGSAAGIVAMNIERRLTFGTYLKIATVPAIVSYAAGMLVWWLQLLAVRSLQ